MSGDEEGTGEDVPSAPSGAGNTIKAADSKLSLLLLGPSATVVGNFLEEKTKGLVDRFRAAKDETVQAHASRVVEVVGRPQELKPGQVVRIERWFRIAGEVPVEDAARAAIIEAVLADIFSTDDDADYQDVAEKITSAGARVLLDARNDASMAPKEADQPAFDQLKSLGLAKTPSRRNFAKQAAAWLVGALVGLAVLFGLILRYAPEIFPQVFPSRLATEFVIEAVLASVFIVGIGVAFVSTRYRLTDFGRSVQQAARRFYRNPSEQRKTWVLTALLRRPWLGWGGLTVFLVCVLPFVLQAYVPMQLRIDTPPRTVLISTPPVPPAGPATPPPNQGPPPTSSPITVTPDELQGLIDFWSGAMDQMDGIANLTAEGDSLAKIWSTEVAKDRGSFAAKVNALRTSINERRSSLQELLNIYNKYPNVASSLAQVPSAGVFTELAERLDGFYREILSLQAPLTNFESRLRPFAKGLRTALDNMTSWAKDTRAFAKQQHDQLAAQQK
jgi:hypothetical protein